MGEIRVTQTSAHFQRGVTEYPAIGDAVIAIGAGELKLVFNIASTSVIDVGHLQQDPSIGAYVDVNDMVNKHFAVLGSTGVGKSSGVALILRPVAGGSVPGIVIHSVSGAFLDLPMPLIWMAVSVLVSWKLLYGTRFGLHLFAIGGGVASGSGVEDAARNFGVADKRDVALAYVLSACFAALAGVFLAARIVSGELTKGERLPTEREIALSYGVSRNVVREAIRALSKDGLVTVRQGSGTFVADATSRALGDSLSLALRVGGLRRNLAALIEIRQIIEPSVAGLAAERATPEDIRKLEGEVETMERAFADVDA